MTYGSFETDGVCFVARLLKNGTLYLKRAGDSTDCSTNKPREHNSSTVKTVYNWKYGTRSECRSGLASFKQPQRLDKDQTTNTSNGQATDVCWKLYCQQCSAKDFTTLSGKPRRSEPLNRNVKQRTKAQSGDLRCQKGSTQRALH